MFFEAVSYSAGMARCSCSDLNFCAVMLPAGWVLLGSLYRRLASMLQDLDVARE